MNKSKLITLTALGAIVLGSVAAFAGTYTAWGHTFTYDNFQPQTLDVTVATDRETGHKMNLVRMKNGHMMALVPADRYVGLMSIPDDDMIR